MLDNIQINYLNKTNLSFVPCEIYKITFKEKKIDSQPYSTIGNIIVLYILIFKYLKISQKKKVFGLNNNKDSLLYVYVFIYQQKPKYLEHDIN